MSTPTPPPLPTETTIQQPQVTALRSFINNITASLQHGLSQRRPWSELIDRTQFNKPDSVTDATSRIRKNYSYFRINYLAIIGSILAFSLLSHPFSLLTLLGLLSAWIFLYLFRPSDQPLTLFGRTYSDRETLGILIVLSIVVVFLTSVGSLLISALLAGFAVVCVHGAFRVPEDLFLDEVDAGPGASAATGLLSFLGGAASNAANAAAPPVVASRV